jgi:hypothetical protein
MTDEQILKKFRKREKVCGKWMAERGYDAWDIYHKGVKLSRYVAITKDPLGDMMRNDPGFGYSWDDMSARKRT